MAQRERTKAKPSRPAHGGASETQRLEARVKAAERERDKLKAELAAARDRIAALEETRTQVANRIDWVIDSLAPFAQRGA